MSVNKSKLPPSPRLRPSARRSQPTARRSRRTSKTQKLGNDDAGKTLKASVKSAKAEASIPIKTPAKKPGLVVDVFDVKGKAVGKVTLPSEIFGAKINKELLSQAVRVYLANQRMGTAKTKDRGEVHGTTRKVWQQKGTGRARHGSRRAPIFVHGGVAFGPRPHDFSLKLSKKMKTRALFSALSSKVKDRELKIVTGLEKLAPKTKIMARVLEDLGIGNKKIVLVTPTTESSNFDNIYRSARNIEGVRILNSNMLNAYKVLDNKLIILMRDAIGSIKNNFLRER
ncbi:MAG: 50S ribosomal protein L4 [Patescibacteria group bacterium]